MQLAQRAAKTSALAAHTGILHTQAVDEPAKSKSAYFPGQPVPAEFFVGRAEQVGRILQRGAGQVANLGTPPTRGWHGELSTHYMG